jgi:hypothetical protein
MLTPPGLQARVRAAAADGPVQHLLNSNDPWSKPSKRTGESNPENKHGGVNHPKNPVKATPLLNIGKLNHVKSGCNTVTKLRGVNHAKNPRSEPLRNAGSKPP